VTGALTGELVTQAEYARRRGVKRWTVYRRTVPGGGSIPVHGARKLIEVAEADRLWTATVATQGLGSGNASGVSLVAARAAALALDVEVKRLALDERRGVLISREAATRKAFAFGRLWRDAWLAWPARVAPLVAAAFELDAGAVTVMLDAHVREHLADLTRERPEF